MDFFFINNIFFLLKQSFKYKLSIFSIFFEIIIIVTHSKKKKYKKFWKFYKKNQLDTFLFSKIFFLSLRNLKFRNKKTKKQKKKRDLLKTILQKLIFGFFFQIPEIFSCNSDYFFYFYSFILSFLKFPICPFKFIGCVLFKKFDEKFFFDYKILRKKRNDPFLRIHRNIFYYFLIKISKDISEEMRSLATGYNWFISCQMNKTQSNSIKKKYPSKKKIFSKKEQMILVKKKFSAFKQTFSIGKNKIKNKILFYDFFYLISDFFVKYDYKRRYISFDFFKKWIYLQINLDQFSRWFFIEIFLKKFCIIKKKIIEMISFYFKIETEIILDLKCKNFISRFINQNIFFCSTEFTKGFLYNLSKINMLIQSIYGKKKCKKNFHTKKNLEKKNKIVLNDEGLRKKFSKISLWENFLGLDVLNKKLRTFPYCIFNHKKTTAIQNKEFLDFVIGYIFLLKKKNNFFLVTFFVKNIFVFEKFLKIRRKKKPNYNKKKNIAKNYKVSIFRKFILLRNLIKNFEKKKNFEGIKNILCLKNFLSQKKINFFHFFVFQKNCKSTICAKRNFDFEIKIFMSFFHTFLLLQNFLLKRIQIEFFSKNFKRRVMSFGRHNLNIITFLFKIFFFKTQKIKIKTELLSIHHTIFFFNIRKNKNLKNLLIFGTFYFIRLSFQYMMLSIKKKDFKPINFNISNKLNKKKFNKFHNICLNTQIDNNFKEKKNSSFLFFIENFFSKKINKSFDGQNIFHIEKSILLREINMFEKKFTFFLNIQLDGIFWKKINKQTKKFICKKKTVFHKDLFFIEEKKNFNFQPAGDLITNFEVYHSVQILKNNFPKFTSLTKIFNLSIIKEILWLKKISLRQKARKKILIKKSIKERFKKKISMEIKTHN